MTALTDYLASAECREEVNRLTIPGWDVSEVPPALNALCEQLRESERSFHGWRVEMMKALGMCDSSPDVICAVLKMTVAERDARISELEQFITRQSEIVDETKAACEETLRQAAEKGRELEAENARLLEMLKLAEADIKVMIGEAKPCPHLNHTYRNHGGTRVCADCGEMLEDA
ncbi:MAG: hypothetical protein PHU04_05615 [Candidatus Peribacteraceae bacterium]|nr:hypothetical protein [Candidatus Peribacteraceae bacterium]